MVQGFPQRIVTATTIDKKGLDKAKEFIEKEGYASQINAIIQDIKDPLPYNDCYFDFVYARLVLHYLTNDELDKTLLEIKRVLKPGKKLFIVVRSDQTLDATRPSVRYNEKTGITHGEFIDDSTGNLYLYDRYFHSIESLSQHVKKAGFKIAHAITYDEQLFKDFMRKEQADHTDNVVELLAIK